jgi:hypothetical protein
MLRITYAIAAVLLSGFVLPLAAQLDRDAAIAKAEAILGPMQDRQAVELILSFQKQTIVHRTVFDSAGRVAGLVFRPLDAAVLPSNK